MITKVVLHVKEMLRVCIVHQPKGKQLRINKTNYQPEGLLLTIICASII